MEIRAATAPPILRGNTYQEASLTVAVPAGEYQAIASLVIPSDSFGDAGDVRFRLTGVEWDNTIYIGGIPANCLQTEEPPLLTAAGHDFQNRAETALHARVIESLYTSVADAIPLVRQFLGPLGSIYPVETSGTAGAGAILGVASGRAFMWLIGTTTGAQLTAQGIQYALGPVSFGPFSSIPIYRDAALIPFALFSVAGLPNDVPVTLIGHSLGGAVLAIIAAWLRQINPVRQVELMTFGSPRAGDHRLQAILGTLTNRRAWINTGDVVPFLPPSPTEMGPLVTLVGPVIAANYFQFKSFGGQATLFQDGSIETGSPPSPLLVQLAPTLQAWLVGAPSPIPAAHAIGEYRRRLELGL